MRTRPSFWAGLGLLAALLTGCGSEIAPPAVATAPETDRAGGSELPGALVELSWLVGHLDDPSLVVVDTRPREDYDAGHIAGAVSLTPAELLDPDPGNSRNMAPIQLVEGAVGKAGIDAARTVVLYDGGRDYRAAARVFWVLEVHGHPSVAVLNGGYAAWVGSGGESSTDSTVPTPRRFAANMRPERLATRLSVMRAIRDEHTRILDARSPEEFAGEVSKAERKGHIPGAVNADATSNLAESDDGNCGVRSIDDLLTVYDGLGLDEKVITYCNSGNRASVSYLALRVLGRDAAVYDGSWLEWGNDETLPIEDGVGELPSVLK